MIDPHFEVVTVTLNPAIDRTVTVPKLTLGAVNRVTTVRSQPGGKGVNVAVELVEFGQRIAVSGFLGRENTEPFEQLFSTQGMADHFIRIDGQTRVGIKIVDPVHRQTTDLNFPGLTPSAENRHRLEVELQRLSADWFVLAGSLPVGVEPGYYRHLIGLLKAGNHRVLLDTSGEALREGLKAGPQIIKPNLDELQALLGRTLPNQATVIEACRQLIEQWALSMVVVSLGAEGACFVTADSFVVARPPSLEVESTVGAGDAMVAGIVASQLRHLPLAECARMGTAFASAALSRTADAARAAAGKSAAPARRFPQEFLPQVSLDHVSLARA